ncbi:hypothetical protein [Sphingomonas aerolata]|uniref:hypothetical protein n=1 Tax=Sphingomonas aerolata TaxID=185951 RepID=UPI002FDF753D
MLNEELTTITPYSGMLGTLRRVGEESVMIAVASNFTLPYATPLRALLGILMSPSMQERSSLKERSTLA